MANTTSDHVVRLSADFSDFVRAAKKAGEKSSDLISKAVEAGIKDRSFSGYMKGLTQFEKKRAALEKKHQALAYAHEVQNAGKVGKKLREVAEEIARLNRDLSEENIDAEIKARKTAERNLFQEKCRYLQQLNDGMVDGFADALRAANKELEAITKEQQATAKALTRSTEQQARGAERMSEFMKMFRRDATRGADDFAEKMGDTLSSLRSGLSGIDLGAMISGGAGGLGKGLGGLSEILGGAATGGGALAGLAGALSGITMVLAPLVVAFGAFAAIMFGMDKEIKEFNKSAINAFGTRGVMNVGMPSLTENLTVLRHATQDLTATLGLTESEAVGVFDAFDAGGITLGRFTKGAVDAEAAAERLSSALRSTVSVAKSLGIGVNEFATTMADYTDTLAFSLENVTDQFALISKQAQDAGFSTRRFYSLITQATAGMASMNTHLDTTAELLVRMSKVLGQKAAAEALGGAAGGFKEMGTSERYKTIMTTGAGRTKDLITKAATSAARTFATDFARGTAGEAIGKAIKDAGLDFDTSAITAAGGATYDEAATKNLVDQLAGMTRESQSELIAAVRAGDPATARRLEQLVSLSRGTSGSMADMSDALSALDPGATIAMKLQSAMAILGRPLNELSGVERMAAESITGMSGAQFEEYQRLAADAEGRMMILNRYLERGEALSEDDKKAMAEQYGAIIENGRIVSASIVDGAVVTGTEVTSGMDLLTASIERGDTAIEAARSEELDLAYDAFDATVTIGDILENKILFYLRGLYEDVGQPLITWLSQTLGLGGSTEKRTAAISARGALRDASEAAMERASAARRTISELGIKESQKTITEEESTRLAAARREETVAKTILKEAGDTLRALSSGDYSSLTGTRTRTETVRGVTGGHAVGGRFAGDIETVGPTTRTVSEEYTMSAEELRRSIEARGAAAGAAVPVPATPAVPATAGPAPTPTAAAAATEDAAAAVTDPITESVAESTAATVEEAEETRATLETEAEESRKHITKTLTKDKKVGDMLARSSLPDAIVAAQVKQQIMSLALAAGLSPDQTGEAVAEYMEKGTFSSELQTALTGLDETARRDLAPLAGELGGLLGGGAEGTGLARLTGRRRLTAEEDEDTETGGLSLAPEVTPEVHDFLYRGDGVRGTITPIDAADTVVGAKAGGPLDRAVGGGGSTVNISIYGGDERRVFDVVKRVLRESGVGPGRVTARA